MSVLPEDRLPVNLNGFLFRKSTNSLILNSDNYDSAVKLMKNKRIDTLELNPNFIKIKNLDFLSNFYFINGLVILHSGIIDISPINKLESLKKLIIENKLNGVLDFTKFRNLEYCFLNWKNEGVSTINVVKSLKTLVIENYEEIELLNLLSLSQLESLSILKGNIVNIIGIDRFKNLKKLDLSGCVYLESIEKISSLTSLVELRLDYCKSIKEFGELNQLHELKSLSLNNISEIDSIDFICSLSKLEELFFTDNTNVLDGNLNCLEKLVKKHKLKNIIFKDRRHYSHKRSDLGYRVPDVVANIFKKK